MRELRQRSHLTKRKLPDAQLNEHLLALHSPKVNHATLVTPGEQPAVGTECGRIDGNSWLVLECLKPRDRPDLPALSRADGQQRTVGAESQAGGLAGANASIDAPVGKQID